MTITMMMITIMMLAMMMINIDWDDENYVRKEEINISRMMMKKT